jgi:SH3-like domain-containing protein
MKTKLFHLWLIGIVLLFTTAAYAAGARVSVSASEAKVRSGAGNNFDVIWRSEKYTPFTVIKRVGEWYLVKDYQGDEGWVHQSLVANTPAVITTKSKCNLYSEPKSDSKVLFSVGPGIPFKLVRRKSPWILIEHADGDKGWIQEALVW